MKIGLIGYGKMGKTIEKIATEQGHEIGLIIDKSNQSDLNASNLKKVDVVIEFSTPQTAFDNLKTCFEAGVPVVCGTTAWLDRLDEAKAIATANNTALFYASNFSIGVNITFAANEYLASLMNRFPQYDVTVHEIHHTQKLDAPSGTALTITQGLLSNLDQKTAWKKHEAKEATDIAITTQRIDPTPGTHSVTYFNTVDSIELKHTAHSRQGFAAGAVEAANFVVGKTGFYNMRDLLQL